MIINYRSLASNLFPRIIQDSNTALFTSNLIYIKDMMRAYPVLLKRRIICEWLIILCIKKETGFLSDK